MPMTGATAFVVHEALEVIGPQVSNFSSLAPIITVSTPSPFAGADMTTRLAPASRCAFAFSPLVKNPVDSMTISMPISLHGKLAGSFSASTGTFLPSMMSAPAPVSTEKGARP